LVDGVALSVDMGRVQALVGASGCGKTLTCLALIGLLPTGLRRTAGRIRLAGHEADAGMLAAARGRAVGLVVQNPRTAFNPLARIGSHFAETIGAGWRSRAVDGLREVGFEDPAALLDLYPFQMSGGMLQRVMIALALGNDPAVLIADEPTTDLDLAAQAQVLDLLDQVRRRRGLAVLLVTHDLSVVARLADRVSVMEAGRIVEDEEVAALFDRPRHPTSQGLMQAHLAREWT
jgi:nickel transport system ATP-binding protein